MINRPTINRQELGEMAIDGSRSMCWKGGRNSGIMGHISARLELSILAGYIDTIGRYCFCAFVIGQCCGMGCPGRSHR